MMSALEPWHLDKRVPVALILTIAIQTLGGVWWASSMNSAVVELQKQVAQNTIAAASDSARIRSLELTSGRTEERMLGIQGTLSRIEGLLEDLRP